MIIDFHTHAYPPFLAKKAVAQVQKNFGIVPRGDGTPEGLRVSMKNAGIDLSVLLQVVSKPKQFHTVKEMSMAYLEEGERAQKILCFAGIHPDMPDWKEQLRELKGCGFQGIKLHPDYQEIHFNDIRYKRLIWEASALDLIITTHAGFDVKSPDHIHCTPDMALEVIREVRPEKLVLAHMGGVNLWQEVEEKLLGEDVFLDTGVVFEMMPMADFVRMVRKHGSERILFGTDTPWRDQTSYVEILENAPLTEEEKALIFYKNGCRLLNIKEQGGR